MAEAFVQVAVDGAGKLVDTFTVTDPATLAAKHRQTVVIGDPVTANVANVLNNALFVKDMLNSEGEESSDLLKLILVEIRLLNHLIASEFRVRDDIVAMRNDPSLYIS